MTRLVKTETENVSEAKTKVNMETQKQPAKLHIQKVVPAKTKIIAEPGCRPIGS